LSSLGIYVKVLSSEDATILTSPYLAASLAAFLAVNQLMLASLVA